jgi:prepilin-type N-terminal cleavage/methylation domain-containing protein
MSHRKKHTGFTLVELMVVIAIIANFGQFVIAGFVGGQAQGARHGLHREPSAA